MLPEEHENENSEGDYGEERESDDDQHDYAPEELIKPSEIRGSLCSILDGVKSATRLGTCLAHHEERKDPPNPVFISRNMETLVPLCLKATLPKSLPHARSIRIVLGLKILLQ